MSIVSANLRQVPTNFHQATPATPPTPVRHRHPGDPGTDAVLAQRLRFSRLNIFFWARYKAVNAARCRR